MKMDLAPWQEHWQGGPAVWDQVARELRNTGVATVALPCAMESWNARAFQTARAAFDMVHETPSSVLWIPLDANSSNATGYHTAGGENSLSRYNEHREGFVVSDNQSLVIDTLPEFGDQMQQLSEILHTIADHTLEAIERDLDIEPGWFQQKLGPTKSSSQFHVKRYVVPEHFSSSSSCHDNQPRILLPKHTDPSLISVIVHDAEGCNPGAMGLEYFNRLDHTWRPVPLHGHGVAVLLVGAVLSHLTGNTFPSIQHRVVYDEANPERIAATLFVRPQLTATLEGPPSDQLPANQKRAITFATWISRVSKNYSKGK